MFHPNGLMSYRRCPACVDSAAARRFAVSSIGTGIAEAGTGVQSGKVPHCGRGWLATQ